MVAYRLDNQTLLTIESIAKRFNISQTEVIRLAIIEIAKKSKTHVVEIKTLTAMYDPYDKVIENKTRTIENVIAENEKQHEAYNETDEQFLEEFDKEMDELFSKQD